MEAIQESETSTRIAFKNILFLTDFSEPSEVALPFAVAIAREYGATVHAIHVLMLPSYSYLSPNTLTLAIEAQEENAQVEMKRVESQLISVPHEVSVVRGAEVWPVVEQQIADQHADMIVLGTHGRTGAQRLLLGSVAEGILRQTRIPVLTVGPEVPWAVHNGAPFHRVLFATDFSSESIAAAPYAVSFAQENQAGLILLHVLPLRGPDAKRHADEPSVANILHELHGLVPPDAELWCRPETVVEYGHVAERILHAAAERRADLIVLGVRSAAGHLQAATHLGRTIARQIVVHAKCPVLTVRG